MIRALLLREVTDQQIMDAKAQVGAGGYGCEPASAASVAGAKVLVEEGIIDKDARVVCILTGHQLKDPTATVAYHSSSPDHVDDTLSARGVTRTRHANRPVVVPNDLGQLVEVVRRIG